MERGKASVLEILTIGNAFVVGLYESGLCSMHNRSKLSIHYSVTNDTLFFNKSKRELIRSVFLNKLNDSVIIVSVTKKDDYNSLKCRSVPLDTLEAAFEDGDPLRRCINEGEYRLPK